jgi:hypothetical protein
MKRKPLLTKRDLDAINEALIARLAGELDGSDGDLPRQHYEGAQEKVTELLATLSRGA